MVVRHLVEKLAGAECSNANLLILSLQFKAAQLLRLAENNGSKVVGNSWYVESHSVSLPMTRPSQSPGPTIANRGEVLVRTEADGVYTVLSISAVPSTHCQVLIIGCHLIPVFHAAILRPRPTANDLNQNNILSPTNSKNAVAGEQHPEHSFQTFLSRRITRLPTFCPLRQPETG